MHIFIPLLFDVSGENDSVEILAQFLLLHVIVCVSVLPHDDDKHYR